MKLACYLVCGLINYAKFTKATNLIGYYKIVNISFCEYDIKIPITTGLSLLTALSFDIKLSKRFKRITLLRNFTFLQFYGEMHYRY